MAGLLNYKDDPVFGLIGDTYKGIGGLIGDTASNVWGGMDTMDKAALSTSLIPGVGDVVGAINDARYLYKEPTLANAGMAGLGLLPFVPSLGMVKAWHGTPHKVDKFSMDKIGTGEGAQAYGHGLYFAENADVAGQYKNILSKRLQYATDNALINDVPFSEYKSNLTKKQNEILDSAFTDIGEGMQRGWIDDLDYGDEMADSLGMKIRAAIDDPDNGLFDTNGIPMQISEADADAIMGKMKSAKFKPDPGNLYNVNLDVNHKDLLDWDDVIENKSLDKLKETDWWEYAEESMEQTARGDNPTGQDLYNWLLEDYTPEEASKVLADAGIPGIRYLDAGSRNAKEGTRNLVIFDDSLIDIVKGK